MLSTPIKSIPLVLSFILFLMLSVSQVNSQNNPLAAKKAYIDPDNYGAEHSNLTFERVGITQEEINRNYFGIGATIQDNIDWAAWQLAVNEAAVSGKMIIAYGEYYFGGKQVLFPKTFKSITIQGSSCYIHVTGNNGLAVFGRPTPKDNGEANIMVSSFVRIEGLQIACSETPTNRIGFDLGPTYNSIYRGIDAFSLFEAIHLRFALNTEVDMCMATNCISGWKADMGDWPGATNSNSQSNHTSFNHCRFYATDNSDVAFGIYACSGCSVTNCIIEGQQVKRGCDFDSKGSTVVKDFSVFNVHFECVQGATDAFVKLRMMGGIVTIDKVFGQYAAYMVDATAVNGTYGFVEISHVAYWKPLNGKYFKNGGVNWVLNGNDNMYQSPRDAVNKFAGKVPVYCETNSGCGGNSVAVHAIPR